MVRQQSIADGRGDSTRKPESVGMAGDLPLIPGREPLQGVRFSRPAQRTRRIRVRPDRLERLPRELARAPGQSGRRPEPDVGRAEPARARGRRPCSRTGWRPARGTCAGAGTKVSGRRRVRSVPRWERTRPGVSQPENSQSLVKLGASLSGSPTTSRTKRRSA